MKLLRSLVTVLSLLLCTVSFAQATVNENAAEALTKKTAFPISSSDPWLAFSQDHDGYYYFFSGEDVDFNRKIVTVWVRIYKFDKRILELERFTINRTNKEFKFDNLTQYALSEFGNGEIIRGPLPGASRWFGIIPGSIAHQLLKCVEIFDTKDFTFQEFKASLYKPK